MAQLDKKHPLRGVKLKAVAAYLGCSPEKLRIALKHLGAVPTSVRHAPVDSVDSSVIIVSVAQFFTFARDWARLYGYYDPVTFEAAVPLDTRPVDPQAAKWVN